MSNQQQTIEKTVKAAVLQELVDRSEEAGLFHSAKAFEVTTEPGAPLMAISPSQEVETANDTYANILELVIDPFDNAITDIKDAGTFRRTNMDDFSKGEMGGELQIRADNWADMITGLNKVLSKQNQIDPAVLGRGK